METGVVKWFDPKRGFGFVVSPTGEDVLLHVSALKDGGFHEVCAGASVDYERHERRALAARVVAVRDVPTRHAKGDTVRGTIKWFNRDKGVGFIERAGAADVLVTFETVRASGVAYLNPGDRVSAVIERRPVGDRALLIKVEAA